MLLGVEVLLSTEWKLTAKTAAMIRAPLDTTSVKVGQSHSLSLSQPHLEFVKCPKKVLKHLLLINNVLYFINKYIHSA